MAAKKKTVQETRKAYVQAKIATNSAAKNPAKLRQEFNAKAATVKGRTEIVQTLGVAGTPQAQMLRATLRSFPTASTGASKPAVTNNVNMPQNNSDLSAVVRRVDAGYTPSYPGVKKVVRRVDAGYTPSYPSATKVGDNKNVYGDTFEEKVALKLEKYKIPVFGRVAGIGRAIDAGDTSGALKKLGKAVLVAGATGATGNITGTKTLAGIRNIPVPGPLQQPVIQLMVGAIKAKKFLQSGGPVVKQLPPGVVGAVKTTTKTLGKTMGKTPGRLKNTR